MGEVDVRDALAATVAPFERSLDLVAILDEAGQLVASNRAATERPVDLAHADVRRAVERAVASGEPVAFEWGESGAGGVRAWYVAQATPIEVNGRRAGLCVSSRDVTELKRSEARLRRSEELMVDTQGVAHLGTWDWDITQPTAVWSAELYRIYRLTPETYTPSYEAYLTKVHPDDRQRVIDATNRVFHEHVPYSHDERIFWPDGTVRYLHTWAFPVLDDDGKLARLVGVCQDITDRKRAEEALQKLNTDLEQRVTERTEKLAAALRDLEAFNSMVSHDLRSPLAVIQMAAEVIERERGLPEKVTGMTQRIRKSVAAMSDLLSDLLTFAKVGDAALQPVEVDASALAHEVVADLQLASPDRTVAVTIEPSLRVRADSALLRVVLANLVGNAWKYSANAAAARIEVGAVQRPDGYALFVRDNGIGFDMTEASSLFRPFSRLGNARDFKGTGVGLATVHRIVERHGGTVRGESALGKGATFFVTLPAR